MTPPKSPESATEDSFDPVEWQVFAPFTGNLSTYRRKVETLTRDLAAEHVRHQRDVGRIEAELAESQAHVELHERAIELLQPLKGEAAKIKPAQL